MTAMRVVLQARTTSTRLPAKALLPIAGMPSSILAAKRAARDGLDLVFATSTDPTDDQLAALAGQAGLKTFRGSKDDVLGRYAAATADLADDDLVLRITGDDPVPDTDFLRALAVSRAKRGVEMLFSMSPADGLPHGVAAQAFSAGALRRAASSATAAFEREHVGPWLVRNTKSAVFDDYAALDLGHLRCTLDTIDDYFALGRLFDGVTDPIGTPWRALVDKLAAQDKGRGMPFRYLRGMPGGEATVERIGALVPDADAFDDGSAVAVLRRAIGYGATLISTSPGVGARRTGAALAQGWSGRASVILRLAMPPVDNGNDWADRIILGALRDLGLSRVHTLTFPVLRGPLVEHLLTRKEEGWFSHIGIAEKSLDDARPWLSRGAKHLDIEFDRGLPLEFDAGPGALVLARCASKDAMRTALARDWIDGAVVGITSLDELAAFIDSGRAARSRG